VSDITPVSNPNYLDSHSCDWCETPAADECGESPAAYVGDIYYACPDHFEDRREWLME